jgi:hypothetical protein
VWRVNEGDKMLLQYPDAALKDARLRVCLQAGFLIALWPLAGSYFDASPVAQFVSAADRK